MRFRVMGFILPLLRQTYILIIMISEVRKMLIILFGKMGPRLVDFMGKDGKPVGQVYSRRNNGSWELENLKAWIKGLVMKVNVKKVSFPFCVDV